MPELRNEDPGSFFISTLNTCPWTRYNSLLAMTSVVNLGVEDFGDFDLVHHSTMIGGVGLNTMGIGFRVAGFKH